MLPEAFGAINSKKKTESKWDENKNSTYLLNIQNT
jgi:hypothetical protein